MDGIQLLSEHEYLANKRINHVETGATVSNVFGSKVYYFNNGVSVVTTADNIHFNKDIIPKLHNSQIVVHNESNLIVYITPNLILSKLHITTGGNAFEKITRVTINAVLVTNCTIHLCVMFRTSTPYIMWIVRSLTNINRLGLRITEFIVMR